MFQKSDIKVLESTVIKLFNNNTHSHRNIASQGIIFLKLTTTIQETIPKCPPRSPNILDGPFTNPALTGKRGTGLQ